MFLKQIRHQVSFYKNTSSQSYPWTSLKDFVEFQPIHCNVSSLSWNTAVDFQTPAQAWQKLWIIPIIKLTTPVFVQNWSVSHLSKTKQLLNVQLFGYLDSPMLFHGLLIFRRSYCIQPRLSAMNRRKNIWKPYCWTHLNSEWKKVGLNLIPTPNTKAIFRKIIFFPKHPFVGSCIAWGFYSTSAGLVLLLNFTWNFWLHVRDFRTPALKSTWKGEGFGGLDFFNDFLVAKFWAKFPAQTVSKGPSHNPASMACSFVWKCSTASWHDWREWGFWGRIKSMTNGHDIEWKIGKTAQ